MKDGPSVTIYQSTLKPSTRIVGSKFTEELKKVDDKLKKKSRLIAKNCADGRERTITTKSPTVQLFSQRITLSVAASIQKMPTYTRDIKNI